MTVYILHVDDEPDIVDLTREFLSQLHDDWTISKATNVLAGLEELNGHIDCIISDFDMPEQNGIEFLKTVRNDHPALPFILFTGKGAKKSRLKPFLRG